MDAERSSQSIPKSHLDLLLEPVYGVLTTMMPNGQPQMSIVWVDYDGTPDLSGLIPSGCVLINTTLERQKAQNMLANPKVNVLVIDPRDGTRFLEVRGEVADITEEGAIAHADKLTRLYSNGEKQHFYGDIYPEERRGKETRVIVKILPRKVTINAVFA